VRRSLTRVGGRDFLVTTFIILTGLLPFLLAPWRAQALGPIGRGEFAYFQASFSVIAAISVLGLRHAYYGVVENSDARFALLGRDLVLVTLGLGLLAGIPLATIAYFSLSPTTAIGILVASLGGPFFALTQIEVADAQLHARRKRIAGMAGTPPLIELFGTLGLLAVRQLNIMTAILSTLASESGRIIVGVSSRMRDGGMKTVKNPPLVRSVLSAAWKLAPATLVPLLANNVDSLIYGALSPTGLVGLYAVAKIGTSLFMLTAITLEGMFLRTSTSVGLGKTLAVSAVGLPLVGLIGAIAGMTLVPILFGEEFSDAGAAFPVTATAGVLGALYVWLSAVCAGEGLHRASFVSAVVMLLALAGGSYFVAVQPGLSVSLMGWPLILAYGIGSAIAAIALWQRRTKNAR
jgi:O-antigen/teichoic acid export membrane protein